MFGKSFTDDTIHLEGFTKNYVNSTCLGTPVKELSYGNTFTQ